MNVEKLTKKQTTEKNPWLSITEGNVKIAECDVPYFERKGYAHFYFDSKGKLVKWLWFL